MNRTTQNDVQLSAAGTRRKRAIEAELATRAGHRRVGLRVLGGAAGAVAVVLVGLLVHMLVPPSVAPRATPVIVQKRLVPPNAAPQPAAPVAASVIVRVVTNEPLPTRPCGESGSGGSGSASICVLSDDQLLAALSQTGESYGIVRVGGKTRVVANSAH